MGPKGQEGPQGISGLDGEMGDAGTDASPKPFIPGPPGPMGEEGLFGPPGPPGMPGIDGPMGAQGPRGKKGKPGFPGNDGAAGAEGLIGEHGEEGNRGVGVSSCHTFKNFPFLLGLPYLLRHRRRCFLRAASRLDASVIQLISTQTLRLPESIIPLTRVSISQEYVYITHIVSFRIKHTSSDFFLVFCFLIFTHASVYPDDSSLSHHESGYFAPVRSLASCQQSPPSFLSPSRAFVSVSFRLFSSPCSPLYMSALR